MNGCLKQYRKRSKRERLLALAGIAVSMTLGGCASSSAQPPPASPAVPSPPASAQKAAPVAIPQTGARIGVVDLQKVLIETEAGKKARETLGTFMKNRQAVVELEEKELKRMEEDLIKQASVLSAAAKKDREDQLRRRVVEFQQRANDLNREVQEKQKEVLEDFRERAERVVGRVAQQLGLSMVMEKGRGGPTVYSDSSLDVSARVIEEFNRGQ